MAQITRNATFSISAASTEILPANLKRVAFVIIPITAGITATIAKGTEAAIANAGIVLSANQPYGESDGAPFRCWRGNIQAIGSGNGSLAVMETIEV